MKKGYLEEKKRQNEERLPWRVEADWKKITLKRRGRMKKDYLEEKRQEEAEWRKITFKRRGRMKKGYLEEKRQNEDWSSV